MAVTDSTSIVAYCPVDTGQMLRWEKYGQLVLIESELERLTNSSASLMSCDAVSKLVQAQRLLKGALVDLGGGRP